MSTPKIYISALCVLSIAATAQALPSPALQIRFTPAGLQSIRYLGTEFLARSSFEVNAVHFESPSGVPRDGNTKHDIVVNAAARSEKLRFDWGAITVRYSVASGKLLLDIATNNLTKFPLCSISYDALALRFPARPLEYDGSAPLLGTNIGAPTLLAMTYGANTVALSNEDTTKPLLVGFPWALDKPVNRVFPLRINTGREAMYPNSLPPIERSIAPGATDRFRIALRFGPAPVDWKRLAPDILGLFAKAHPFALSWPDRRPIGSLIIGTSAAGWPKNPRGWFLDSKVDITSQAGIESFRRRLLAWADRSIVILKSMNAQGMVTWDIEGEQFRHPTTYIGDPQLAETLAPEMRPVIDEYFARFVRAGLRVGVTIRPQTVLLAADGKGAQQQESSDPAAALLAKIAYARKRWGATLFYIDSNGDQALPLSFDVIKRVAEAHPDVLLMPEHKNASYYSMTAPYTELRGGFASTPSLVRDIYKDAFSVINTADGELNRNYPELEKAVARGDILMFRAWYNDPANLLIRKLTAVGSSTKP